MIENIEILFVANSTDLHRQSHANNDRRNIKYEHSQYCV